jgi:RimJ/RimL family protein N-acetyltransferase
MTERPAQPRPELLPLPDGVASGRVEVRRYRPGDGSAFFAALAPQREELMQWMMWPQKHQRPEDSESYVVRMHAEFALRSNMPMGIWNKSGEFLGGSGFHAPDWNTPKAEIGYFLLPAARRQGLACEVVRLLIQYAFEHMQVNRVYGTCDAGNAASANVMRRAGLAEEGLLCSEARDHHGRLRDTLMFGLATAGYPAWVERHGARDLAYMHRTS